MTGEKWVDARKAGIGGSDAAACLGLNPWTTARMLYDRKIGLRDGPRTNEAMEWGHRLEAAVLRKLGEETGINCVSPMLVAAELQGEDTGSGWADTVAQELRGRVEPTPFDDGHVLWRSLRPLPFGAEAWMLATVDAFGVHEDGRVFIMEAKTTGAHNFGKWASSPPDAAHLQVVHYLAVFGLATGWIGCLAGGNRWAGSHRVDPPAELTEALIQAEADLIRRIANDDPPPEVERDVKAREATDKAKARGVRVSLSRPEAQALYSLLDGMLDGWFGQKPDPDKVPDLVAMRDKVKAAALRGADG